MSLVRWAHRASPRLRGDRRLAAVALAALAGAAGCSASVVDEGEAPADTTMHALVRIDRNERLDRSARERVVAADADGAHDEGRGVDAAPARSSDVSVKFLRVPGALDADAAERVLGTQLDLPPVGACEAIQVAPPAYAATPGTIELLDAGDVSLRLGDEVVALAPRAFPDVGGIASGVFYTSPDATRELPQAAACELRASGSSSLEPLAVHLDAPDAPRDATLDGVRLEARPALDLSRDAQITWAAGSPPREPRDLVYVDLVSTDGAAGVRCTFADAGSGTVPASMLDGLADGSPRVSISIHRVRRTAFVVPELDKAEARFDLAASARVDVLESPR